jgi:hypothetical protein
VDDLSWGLNDLARRADARDALRSAMKRRIEQVLAIRQVFHLVELIGLVQRFVGRGRSRLHLHAVEAEQHLWAVRVHAGNGQQELHGLAGILGRR